MYIFIYQNIIMYIVYFYIPTYNLTICISYISPFLFVLRATQHSFRTDISGSEEI